MVAVRASATKKTGGGVKFLNFFFIIFFPRQQRRRQNLKKSIGATIRIGQEIFVSRMRDFLKF